MSGPSSNFDEPKNSVGIIIINANEVPKMPMQDRKTGISPPPYRNTKQQVFSVCKKPIQRISTHALRESMDQRFQKVNVHQKASANKPYQPVYKISQNTTQNRYHSVDYQV